VPPETLRAEVGSPGGGNGTSPAAGGAGGGEVADETTSLVAQQERGDAIRAAAQDARATMVAQREQHQTRVSEAQATSQREVADLVQANGREQTTERANLRRDVQRQRGEWTEQQRTVVEEGRRDADNAGQQGERDVTTQRDTATTQAAQRIREGNAEIATARQTAQRDATRERQRAQRETSGGGFFSWLGSKVTSFFNEIKNAIRAAFEAARRLVRAAIERAQRLATAAIEAARQAVVGIIQRVGAALIAIGDRVLARFPGLRDRFRRAIREGVERATARVNQLADGLKRGVQAALNLLGRALDAALGLLERAYLAAVDAVAGAIQSAIQFARSVVQGLAAFAELIKDIAAGPAQWLSNLGRAVVDGIRNCLWSAFKRAVRTWFNQKLEEVLGLPIALFQLLLRGGINMAQIGRMAWEGLKAAIPIVLIQLLIEKLVAMIVPAAGAILTIIEGLRAAWGTVSRIITAFQLFFTFLKAVKTGAAAGPFANAVAAAAVVVIDFVANWLLMRLRRPAGAIAGRLRALGQRIGAGLRRAGQAARRGVGAVRQAVVSGARAVGRGIARGARAVGRRVAGVGRAIARTGVGRAVRRGFAAVRRGVRAVRGRFQRARERFRQRREQRRQNRQAQAQERLRRAVAAIRPPLTALLRRGTNRLFLRARLAYWRLRYRLSALRITSAGRINARVNPDEDVAGSRPIDPESLILGIDLQRILAAGEESYETYLTTRHPQGREEYREARSRIVSGRPGESGFLGGAGRDVQTALLRERLLPPGRQLLEPGIVGRVPGAGGHLGQLEITAGGSYPTIQRRLTTLAASYGIPQSQIAGLLSTRRPEALRAQLANLEANLGGPRATRQGFVNRLQRSGLLTQALEPARFRGLAAPTNLAYLLAQRGTPGVGLPQIIGREGGLAPATPQRVASELESPQRTRAQTLQHERVGRILSVIRREARSNIIVLESGYDVAELRRALESYLSRELYRDERELIRHIVIFFRSYNRR
jgi:hypothetical protein